MRAHWLPPSMWLGICLIAMHVLMLGWEYPPHIAGGLGTACQGLTSALARQGVQIDFIMPRVAGDEDARHMRLHDASVPPGPAETGVPLAGVAGDVRRHLVPAALQPYWTEAEYARLVESEIESVAGYAGSGAGQPGNPARAERVQYGGNIFAQVARFTEGALQVGRRVKPAVIHAHDWMTFPAGVTLQRELGRPLIAHVHSLEYDRSGEPGMNPRIHELERLGIEGADAVIAVSHYTKGIICRMHHVPPEKVHVVHNGIYKTQAVRHYQAKHPEWPRHVVLFLGRVTFQKGPDYFVRAAAKVLPHMSDVLFVVAGAGDMLQQVQRLARDLGVESHFYFPGFVRGKAVEELLSVADLYVMPSVSEPFGISALEAINFAVPAVLTKQSGVVEVVGHSLKFDFWDVDRLADLIINALTHEELRADMIDMARSELEKVRWDAAAAKTKDLYQHMLES